MSYPGSTDLDAKVQQRILTAFGESVRLYREGHGEECRTILRSILEVDPKFSPAQRLEDAVVRGAQVDLAQLLGAISAASPLKADETLARAREAIARRDFQGAVVLAQSLLRELPGHPEARALALEGQSRIRAAGEVEGHLARAEEALAAGMLAEATGFVKLALAADPGHPRLQALTQRLEEARIAPEPESEPEFQFETYRPETAFAAEPPAAGRPAAAPPGPPSPPAAAPAPPEPLPPELLPSPAALAPPARPPVPPAPAAPSAAPAVEPGDGALFTFDEAAGEVEFGGARELDFSPPSAAPAADGTEAKIRALLDQGQEAFDRGDHQAAIDSWSRIYLLDAQNSEAERRIEQARRRSEEGQRLAEHRFYEAREAFEEGRREDARALCQEVLALVPQHLEAHDLLARLETPSAPPPPPSEPPDEVDLFKDDFVPAKLSSSGAFPIATAASAPVAMERPVVKPSRRAAAPGRRLPVSIPLLAGIGGMVVVLALVGLLLRGTVFSSDAAAAAAALAEADRLVAAGKLQEAITLLQNTEAEGEEANQLNQRSLELTRQLRARSKTVASSAGDARKALAAGERLKALRLVGEGLAKVPGDPELVAVRDEVVAYAPAYRALAEAIAARKWESARLSAAEILERHPGDPEAASHWRAATFNAAVAALRTYQVAAAHRLLLELQSKGDDPEVKRLAEMAGSYLSRPVDPRYQIFVGTIELRSFE